MLKMIGHRNNLISLTYVLFFAFSAVHADGPIVHTQNGTLEGMIMQTRLGKNVIGFIGIPYAKPPLGELRFQPPEPAAAWNGVRSVKEDLGTCPQRDVYTNQKNVVGVEDCLYLNVYTPKLPPDNETSTCHQFPVMIWLHGGGWLSGNNVVQEWGPQFLLDHNVVLVAVNYRLAQLGFLSTEDLECPGNAGMKDQVQAMRWVQENIAVFGGDPNRVTIFGQSAGSVSVHYHMISPLSRDLFHRGISESGTLYCPSALTLPGLAKERAKRVGEHFNCPTENSKELIACLRTKDAHEIIATDRLFEVFGYDPMIPFRPVIEPDHPGAFLTKDPILATREGDMANKPWITGVTAQESLRAPNLYGIGSGDQVEELNDEYKKLMPYTLLYFYTCKSKSVKDEVSDKIRKFYFGDRAIDDSTRWNAIEMYSDSWFIHGAYSSAQNYINTQTSPLYFYHFTYKRSGSMSEVYGDPIRNYGVSHADDLQYLFPVGEVLFPNKPFTKEDDSMIDTLTNLWFNFANCANPTPKGIPVKWEPVKTYDIEYLEIGKNITMKKGFLPERMQFWNEMPECISPKPI